QQRRGQVEQARLDAVHVRHPDRARRERRERRGAEEREAVTAGHEVADRTGRVKRRNRRNAPVTELPYDSSPVPARDRRIMLGLGLLAVVAALTQTLEPLEGLQTGLLFLAPALFLALPLVAGRYVGEETVA